MRITYYEAARDDVTRQFRYYLVTLNRLDVAIRFRDAVRTTATFIARHPYVCPPCPLSNPRLQNLRSWPVSGFSAVRLYFVVERNTVKVIRLLHGKRNVRAILEHEQPAGN